MGIMKEKLEAVMSEWDKEDEVQIKTRKPMSPERLEKLRAQASAARAIRAAKKVERLKAQNNVGVDLSAALPARYAKKESPWAKRQAEIINGMSVMQARALYDELKKIFGG
jgi:hypothetical protein